MDGNLLGLQKYNPWDFSSDLLSVTAIMAILPPKPVPDECPSALFGERLALMLSRLLNRSV